MMKNIRFYTIAVLFDRQLTPKVNLCLHMDIRYSTFDIGSHVISFLREWLFTHWVAFNLYVYVLVNKYTYYWIYTCIHETNTCRTIYVLGQHLKHNTCIVLQYMTCIVLQVPSVYLALSCFLKVWIVEHDVTERGREFQMFGPADLNPHEPKTVLTCRTQSLCALEERRARKGT